MPRQRIRTSDLLYFFVEKFVYMKRKLIDITDSTFETLNAEASRTGTNLKNYIENMLDHKARPAGQLYCFPSKIIFVKGKIAS